MNILSPLKSLYGKVPPSATDVEEVMLGALLLDKNAFHAISTITQPDHFYTDAHKHVFSAIQQLSTTFKPVDIISVCEHLKSKGLLDQVGGPYYISSLTNKVASADNIEHHAFIILQYYIQREVIRLTKELNDKAYENYEDALECLSDAQNSLDKIHELINHQRVASFSDQVLHTLDQTLLAAENPQHITGIPTGFPEKDGTTQGRSHGDLIVIAGRPSQGKTTLALNEALFISSTKKIAFFSLEMPEDQLIRKLLAIDSSIELSKIRRGFINEHEKITLVRSGQNLMELDGRFFLFAPPSLNIKDLISTTKKLKRDHGLDAIYIDYLQLMDMDDQSQNRDQAIGTTTRGLKKLAKELKVPIIILSQLSRAVEATNDKRPNLSHLRESGNIEQDADIVEMIYRPEYYKFPEVELQSGQTIPSTNIMEIIIAKNRNGATASHFTIFLKHLSKITQYQPNFPSPNTYIEPNTSTPF